MALNDLMRLAMFERWDERCVWCTRPLIFADMEVEHLLPKSLQGEERRTLLSMHRRPDDFDLDALENLAPSCGPCNRTKGKRPPPDAPRITTLLRDAQERAPTIRADAAKLSENRKVQHALTIVRAAVDAGNEEAVRQLREAADELRIGFQDATGRTIGSVHPALEPLFAVGEYFNRADPDFSYAASVHETGGPGPTPPPETIMSIAEVAEAMTSRIDVIPRSPDALERYGPQFSLRPTDDEAGRRARVQLEAALRRGGSVEIAGGLEVSLERLPAGLEQLVGRTMTGGTIRIQATHAHRAPDWHAAIRAASQAKKDAIRITLQPSDDVTEAWDDELVGRFGGLTVRVGFRQRDNTGQIRWNLAYARDRSSVRAQLAVLKFLSELRDGNRLIVEDRGPSKRPTVQQAVSMPPLGDSERALLAFLTDVRTIEEWSGNELALPDALTAGEARDVALVADTVRRQGREVVLGDIRARMDAHGVELLRSGGRLKVEQEISAIVLGSEVPLGRSQVEVDGFRLVSVEDVADSPHQHDVVLVPADDAAANVFERLLRPARRPPPPPPRKARREKSKKRR